MLIFRVVEVIRTDNSMTIEKWQYTKTQFWSKLNEAISECPKISIEDLKVGDRILDDNKKGFVVIKTFAKRKPLLSKLNRDMSVNDEVVKCTQSEYILITDNLIQFVGISHEDSVIKAVLEGQSVPKEVVKQFKKDISSKYISYKETVLSHFGSLTFGCPSPVSSKDLWHNGRDYHKLINDSNYYLWFSMLSDWSQGIVNEYREKIELYEKFLTVVI